MELVLVVKRRDLEVELGLPVGYAPLEAAHAARLLELIEARGFFVERRHAEQDPELKQPIPYCLVQCGAELLCVRRTKRSSEGRLHGAWSIGIGGHIEPQDRLPSVQDAPRQDGHLAHNVALSTSPRGIVERAARRELFEELELPLPSEAELIGWLNDDSNAVGAVHLGLVHLLRVENAAEVAIRETERLEGGFVPSAWLQTLRLHASRDTEATTNARTALRAVAREAGAPRGEPRSLVSPSSSTSQRELVPPDWSSLESWSRLALEALRPHDLAAPRN
jgi:predicted NUDIX family phosphoesterase